MSETIKYPSGFEVTKEDYFKLGNVFTDNICDEFVTVGLVNTNPAATHHYLLGESVICYNKKRPDEKLSMTFNYFVNLFEPEPKKYQVWLDGYRATSEDYQAQYIGATEAYCFKEAVAILYKDRPEVIDLSSDLPYLRGWGHFYDNEQEARAFNG